MNLNRLMIYLIAATALVCCIYVWKSNPTTANPSPEASPVKSITVNPPASPPTIAINPKYLDKDKLTAYRSHYVNLWKKDDKSLEEYTKGVRELMQVSDDIHWQYKYELLIALYHDDIDKFRTELANGMDPNLTFYLLTSPDYYLNEAIKFGISDIAHLLIAAGADPNRMDGGLPPLMQASSYAELDVMEDLIEHGADVNKVVADLTPLFMAFESDDLEAIKMLIEHGGSVEIAVQTDPQRMRKLFHHFQGTDVEWYLQSQGVSIRQ